MPHPLPLQLAISHRQWCKNFISCSKNIDSTSIRVPTVPPAILFRQLGKQIINLPRLQFNCLLQFVLQFPMYFWEFDFDVGGAQQLLTAGFCQMEQGGGGGRRTKMFMTKLLRKDKHQQRVLHVGQLQCRIVSVKIVSKKCRRISNCIYIPAL